MNLLSNSFKFSASHCFHGNRLLVILLRVVPTTMWAEFVAEINLNEIYSTLLIWFTLDAFSGAIFSILPPFPHMALFPFPSFVSIVRPNVCWFQHCFCPYYLPKCWFGGMLPKSYRLNTQTMKIGKIFQEFLRKWKNSWKQYDLRRGRNSKK